MLVLWEVAVQQVISQREILWARHFGLLDAAGRLRVELGGLPDRSSGLRF